MILRLLPLLLLIAACTHAPRDATLNDIHSHLNATKVAEYHEPTTVAALQALVREAKAKGKSVSISGGKHAMGGQQFGAGTVHLNLSRFNRLLELNREQGWVEVESGIQWPELIQQLVAMQTGAKPMWGIRQKQTGADRLSIGGAISANVHGRGLKFGPFIRDIESFTLVDANGDLKTCSRKENAELFRLVTGGYGLFGIIATARLRLDQRVKVRRVVELTTIDKVPRAFQKRIQEGYLYGDFQYSTDDKSPGFLRQGVLSAYVPVSEATAISDNPKELSAQDWQQLYFLGHEDKGKAYLAYTRHYQSTSGQVYWSDTHQMSYYLEDYHKAIDEKLKGTTPGSEMITEVYVRRAELPAFMEEARKDFLADHTNVFYGTVRLIEKDTESFLAWAKESYACIIFNLHVEHSPAGLEKAQTAFRRLIDRALKHGGNYYLTYHRWATRAQVEAAYPQFVDFLRKKRQYDPQEVFQSDWYRHYKQMFVDRLGP